MDHPAVTRDALLHTSRITDTTATVVSRLTGDASLADDLLDTERTILSHDVFGIVGDTFHVSAHVEAAGSAITLLALTEEYNVLVIPPFKYTEDGLRVVLTGTQERIRNAASSVPENIAVQLESVDPYDPERDEIVAQLTKRQRDILATAVECGYYENPRKATHADVAEVLSCSTGTVGEHLRKVEARVLSELVS
jgi:predicted DNA binding protein